MTSKIYANIDEVVIRDHDHDINYHGHFISSRQVGILFMTHDTNGVKCAINLSTLINGNYTVSVKGK